MMVTDSLVISHLVYCSTELAFELKTKDVSNWQPCEK